MGLKFYGLFSSMYKGNSWGKAREQEGWDIRVQLCLPGTSQPLTPKLLQSRRWPGIWR